MARNNRGARRQKDIARVLRDRKTVPPSKSKKGEINDRRKK
jgi:hypothetical protein